MNMPKDFGYWLKINSYNFEWNPIFCSHTRRELGRYDLQGCEYPKGS